MGLLNLTPPVLGQQNSVADAATANAFSDDPDVGERQRRRAEPRQRRRSSASG
jgi:hypothetical protein